MCSYVNYRVNSLYRTTASISTIRTLKLHRRAAFKYEEWSRAVAFIHKYHVTAAGFYFTHYSDLVCSAFCVAYEGLWQEGDDAFKGHQRCCPSCVFIRGLFVGNIPIGSSDKPTTSSEEPTRNREVCGSRFEYRPNSHPERCKHTCLYFLLLRVCSFYSPNH